MSESNEDPLADLHQLQSYTAGLQRMMAEAQAAAAHEAAATDSTGAVRVALGGDGLPTSIDIDPDWRRRIRSAELGRAIVAAAAAAGERRLDAWTATLADRGWQDRADALRTSQARGENTALDELGPTARRELEDVRPRDVNEVMRDLIGTLNSIDLHATAEPARGVGSTAYGKLVVTLSAERLEAVTVDSYWAEQCSPAELNDAMRVALEHARAELSRAAATTPLGRLHQLTTETLALLHRMT
jgi:DNA-binding protein YbaB